MDYYRKEKASRQQLQDDFTSYKKYMTRELEVSREREELERKEYRKLNEKKEEWLFIRVQSRHNSVYLSIEQDVLDLFKDIWTRKMSWTERYTFYKHITQSSGSNKPKLLNEMQQDKDLIVKHVSNDMLSKHIALEDDYNQMCDKMMTMKNGDDEEEAADGDGKIEKIKQRYLAVLQSLEFTCYKSTNRNQILETLQKEGNQRSIFIVV